MLSAQETADMLGMSRQTLYNNWRSWGLKAYKVGRSLRFRERDVEAWLSHQAAA